MTNCQGPRWSREYSRLLDFQLRELMRPWKFRLGNGDHSEGNLQASRDRSERVRFREFHRAIAWPSSLLPPRVLWSWRLTVSLALCLSCCSLMWNTSDFLLQLLSLSLCFKGVKRSSAPIQGKMCDLENPGNGEKKFREVLDMKETGLRTIREENLEFPWVFPTYYFKS